MLLYLLSTRTSSIPCCLSHTRKLVSPHERGQRSNGRWRTLMLQASMTATIYKVSPLPPTAAQWSRDKSPHQGSRLPVLGSPISFSPWTPPAQALLPHNHDHSRRRQNGVDDLILPRFRSMYKRLEPLTRISSGRWDDEARKRCVIAILRRP